LMAGLQCKCKAKKDFLQIITAFGDKINRLRE
jgi:hypothetical protein